MIYNFVSHDAVQDILVSDIAIIEKDIIDAFHNLRRYEDIVVYGTFSVLFDLITGIVKNVGCSHFDPESDHYDDFSADDEVLFTLNNEGDMFLECARGMNGQLKKSDSVICYVQDSCKASDVADLLKSNKDMSILVFGIE